MVPHTIYVQGQSIRLLLGGGAQCSNLSLSGRLWGGYHPTCHKRAAINSALHWLLNIPLNPTAYEDEIQQIGNIIRVNNLNLNVRLIIRREEISQILAQTNSIKTVKTSKKKWLRMPYLGRPSELLIAEFRNYLPHNHRLELHFHRRPHSSYW